MWPLIEKDEKLRFVYEQLELPTMRVLGIMETNGILIDTQKLAQQGQVVGRRMLELETEIFALAGQPFNIQSPKQIGEILFTIQKLPVIKKTPGGAPSTDEEVLQKLFTDMGLEVPNIYATQYFFTTSQYSLFFRAIYNACYLSIDDSEFAAKLLSECNFKEGMVSGLPKGTPIIHKFGESGSQVEMQLHESAIIYAYNKPFLLTVMTKGKDNKTLSKLIKELTNTVYTEMANK